MSDASQYRGLIFELEEAVGDNLDWTEELFGRAAQALKALTETDPSVAARNVYLEQRLEEEMADRNAADEEVVRLQALYGPYLAAAAGDRTEREAMAKLLNGHVVTRGMQVASGATCECGYWTGSEPEAGKRPLPWGRDQLDMHRADVVRTAGYHL